MLKKFTFKLFLFTIPILLGLVVFEGLLRNIPNNYSYKSAYLLEHQDDIELLILGNSHAYRGILAEQLSPNSFNNAYVSQSLDIDFLLFKKYREKLSHLKYVVLTISYPSLHTSIKDSKESWRLKDYNLYHGLNLTMNPSYYSEILNNKFTVSMDKYTDYYKHQKSLQDCDTLGSGPLDGKQDLERTAVASVKRHTKVNSEYFSTYASEIEEMIHYCESHDIKVILNVPPTSKAYFEQLNVDQLDATESVLKEFSENFPSVYYFNSLRSELFSDSDFRDADHLNIKGAERYTELLDNYVKELQ